MLALVATTLPTLAQAKDVPEALRPVLPQNARNVSGFVPKGWTLEKLVRGDLNGDKRPDVALVIRSTDPRLILQNPDGVGSGTLDSNPRSLIVALAQRDGGFNRVGVSHDIIPRMDDPVLDDPFESQSLEIRGGVLLLSIRFWASAGSWSMSTTSFTFRYRNRGVSLIGYDKDEIDRGSGDQITTSINFNTRRMRNTIGSIESGPVKTTWTNIARKRLVRLEDVGNGWKFKPVAEED